MAVALARMNYVPLRPRAIKSYKYMFPTFHCISSYHMDGLFYGRVKSTYINKYHNKKAPVKLGRLLAQLKEKFQARACYCSAGKITTAISQVENDHLKAANNSNQILVRNAKYTLSIIYLDYM